MGWKNSPPVFCTATETAADIANQKLYDPSYQPGNHKLALAAELLHPFSETNKRKVVELAKPHKIQPPALRDPSIPMKLTPLSCVDVFMDDFIAMRQTKSTCCRVQNVLMQTIGQVFCPLDDQDDAYSTKPISVKKLPKGDFSWETCKTILGWINNTVGTTIQLPAHQVQCLGEILASMPTTQKELELRTGTKFWVSFNQCLSCFQMLETFSVTCNLLLPNA